MENKFQKACFILLIFLSVGSFLKARAEWTFDLETGLVWSGYNTIQIPRSTGTRFSLSKDLEARSSYFFRLRIGSQIKPRHHISLFIAPLSLDASGKVNKLIRFEGEEFAAGTPLAATYRFNSYRLTYRYDLLSREKWRVGLGFTAKIRDAAISLEGGSQRAEKTNVGFVPLIHFRVEWLFSQKLGLLLEGDALAAKQGRAEDLLLALQAQLNKSIQIKAGYRIIEGGANVEEVYNFAFLNFFVIGAIFKF